MADDKESIITVKCQGCESECEVNVAVKDGRVVFLGGNNCPTGEAYAMSLARRQGEDRR